MIVRRDSVTPQFPGSRNEKDSTTSSLLGLAQDSQDPEQRIVDSVYSA